MAGGQLAIDSDPPRTVPLDEVDRIEMGAASAVILIWIGQDNHDGAQAGSTAGGTGIQDMHVQCRGIPAARQIVQVVVSGVSAGRCKSGCSIRAIHLFGGWRACAAGSSTADLYLEPPAADCFEQPLDVMLTYDDKSTVKSRIVASTHTDAALKVSKAEGDAKPAAAPVEPMVIWPATKPFTVAAVEIGEDLLRLKLASGPELKIPLAEVRGIWLGDPNRNIAKSLTRN